MVRHSIPVLALQTLIAAIGCTRYSAPQIPPTVPENTGNSAVAEPAPHSPAEQITEPKSATPNPAETIHRQSAKAPATTQHRISRNGRTTDHKGFSSEQVFFVTNRQPSADPEQSSDPDTYFSSTIGSLQYGICSVSIPYRRQPGSLPEPSILRLEFSQDPAKHIVLMELDILPDADFWKQLRSTVDASPKRQLFLFIHGYSATFRDAARRTAQIAWDMNYQGASMFFSWPAGGPDENTVGKLNYLADLRHAEASDYDLLTVLEQISVRSGAATIHVAAHSMGSHLLTESLSRWNDKLGTDKAPATRFQQIVLAAPDVDARLFVQGKASRLAAFHTGLTVYASDSDYALKASRTANSYEPLGQINQWSRLGAKSQLYQLVDVSAVSADWLSVGHLYYGDLPQVIRDFELVFRGVAAIDPKRRLQQQAELFLLSP